MISIRIALLATLGGSVLIGCGNDAPTPAGPANNDAHAHEDDHAHGGEAHAHGGEAHAHDDAHAADVKTDGGAGHGGPVIALGSATAGPFTVVATRDAGPIVAGKDAPIDATVTAAGTDAARPTAVRFWIGTADASGSVKAKADVEDAAKPDAWHTHVEIPDPLPTDAKLYVEVEAGAGAKHVAAFEMKP